jgi:predicted transcriptional regulator of viral defense system
MRRREWDKTLFEIAEGQLGYFTAAQARGAGVHQVRLVQLHRSGDIERASRGVYRLARYPVSPLGHYMEAALWPQVRRPDARGVISHESALALYEISDVSPARVHITLPVSFRMRRAVPRGLVLHYADLAVEDVRQVEGVPVTTPERTIRDAQADDLGHALVRQAIADGRRRGHLTLDVADRLERELFGGTA